jgi:hypothetical protein
MSLRMTVTMTNKTYKDAYEAAKNDLLMSVAERNALEVKIAQLKQTVRALGQMCGADQLEIDRLLFAEGLASDDSLERLGFTDAIRRLFHISKSQTVTPTKLRETLLKLGIGKDQVNLSASVGTVLRRLMDSGEIEKVGDVEFGGGYRLKQSDPIEDALRAPFKNKNRAPKQF